jgi:HK97 family phage major capsid protein
MALGGLVGNLNLPRVTTSVTAGWMTTETTAPNDQTQGFGQVSFTPKEVSANTKVSRLLTLQTSADTQALLASDLLAALGQAIDVCALAGTGTNGQPLGIVNTPGTASGTTFNNGAAIDLQGAVGNRLSLSGGYCAPIATAKLLAKRTRDTTNTAGYVWDGGLYNGVVAGNRAIASDNVPASTIIYGSWDQVIIASWGAMQVEVSPIGTASTDFQQQLIALRIICALDVGVRDPKAFATATTVT